MEMITAIEIINEARGLRSMMRDRYLPELTHREANRQLAKLLKCHDPEFMFYSDSFKDQKKVVGIEPHVLEWLRKLDGPNGRTLFKMLMAQQNADRIYQLDGK